MFFSQIWETDKLLVSMDSTILWKPWWGGHASEEPCTEGLHMDQNPWYKPGRECFQGMVPLYDVTAEVGGLQVIPKSHLDESKKIWKESNRQRIGDFVTLSKNDPMQKGHGKLVLAEAGDLIVWDSRTVHGGFVGCSPTVSEENTKKLARLSQTVCMTPRSKATKLVLEKRKKGFQTGQGFSHWPHEIHVTARATGIYVPIQLSPEQEDLL